MISILITSDTIHSLFPNDVVERGTTLVWSVHSFDEFRGRDKNSKTHWHDGEEEKIRRKAREKVPLDELRCRNEVVVRATTHHVQSHEAVVVFVTPSSVSQQNRHPIELDLGTLEMMYDHDVCYSGSNSDMDIAVYYTL
jgi:hypothetical protein